MEIEEIKAMGWAPVLCSKALPNSGDIVEADDMATDIYAFEEGMPCKIIRYMYRMEGDSLLIIAKDVVDGDHFFDAQADNVVWINPEEVDADVVAKLTEGT